MGESWRISTPAPSPLGCNDSELILPELHPQVTHRVNPLDSTPSSDSFPFPVLLPHFPPTTAQCLLGKKPDLCDFKARNLSVTPGWQFPPAPPDRQLVKWRMVESCLQSPDWPPRQ